MEVIIMIKELISLGKFAKKSSVLREEFYLDR